MIEFPGRPVLEPSTLEYYDYTFASYVGCGHRCIYCYVQNDVDLDWDTEVGIIPDFRKQLDDVLAKIAPQVIYVGGDTDPYQPLETELRHTRQALKAMAERGFSGSILTKSDLVTRDIDILKTMPEPSVGISIAFDDESTRRRFETDARPTARRLEALEAAKRAGIATYALVCPVLPRFTPVAALVEDLSDLADRIWVYSLDIKSAEAKNWKRIEEVMKKSYPDLFDELRAITFTPEHAYWKDLRAKLDHLRRTRGLDIDIFV